MYTHIATYPHESDFNVPGARQCAPGLKISHHSDKLIIT